MALPFELQNNTIADADEVMANFEYLETLIQGEEVIEKVEVASAVNRLRATNAATGVAPKIEAVGTDTNLHLDFRGKGNGLVKISVLRQNNITNSYQNESVILTGWGWKLGDNGTAMSESVTFGITFSAAPVVVASSAGHASGSDPTLISDLVGHPGYVSYEATGITTTGFVIGMTKNRTGADVAQSFSNTLRFGYSWIAIGVL